MFVRGSEVKVVEMAPGITRKVLSYNEELMVCEITLTKGAVLPEHEHENLQTTYVIEGKLSFIIDGVKQVLLAGDSVLIDKNAVHSGVADEDTKVVDIFTPMRKDFL